MPRLTPLSSTWNNQPPPLSRDMLDRGDNATAWATGTAPRGPMSFVPMAESVGQITPKIMDSAFAKPANLAPAASPQPLTVPPPPPIMAPPSAPVRHTNNFNAVPAAGRSMKDPSRIIETLARQNRGDARTQLAAAGFFQGRLDAGSQAEAANARARRDAYEFDTTQQGIQSRHLDTLTAQQNREAVDNNFRMSEEARRQADFAQSMEAPKFVPVPESGGGVIMQGKRLGSGFLPTPHAPQPGMLEFPGTNLAVPTINGDRVPGLPTFEKTPAIPPMSIPWLGPQAGPAGAALSTMTMPGAAPQFKPVTPTAGTGKPPTVKDFDKTGLKPDWRQFNPATGRWGPVQFEDKNGNGVDDSLEGGGTVTRGGGGVAAAVGSLVGRVLKK